ncbi:heat-inducible transcriptional repressor HrcA [Demequina zhanjiangensis]|uniref:Heat-inducible transcription repressor HrcA n=1 Tax=Demequina zhanjiangensis TaxID=3051659 RepID=A0ABT8G0L9_9MICO|nr:heat-inducible transcriptional repressor HrcA [Demequina sp. SYSU T00b26]MDN4472494.1 heat-inducible transcriptional repressor HrcA [Demequina sp. SYSU T00b26]
MTEERRRAVLRAIVEGYVETSEPIGSKALAARTGLGVSPATIRNDMAILEEEGLITQPHTSAGRIPTDKGYRSFVDYLARAALPDSHKRAITTFLSDAVDLNDVIERSVRMLSQLTRQVAVVQYPSLRESAVQRVELVALGMDRILVVVISADARVEQTTVVLTSPVSQEELARAVREVNEITVNRTPTVLEPPLRAWAERANQPVWVGAVAEAVIQAARGGTVQRVVFAGASNLARGSDLEADAIGPVLDALEEQVVLLRLLHEMTAGDSDVAVRIGHETQNEALARTSIVAAGYGSGPSVSLLGALGPTRMDYPSTMAAVRAVARYLSKVVDS